MSSLKLLSSFEEILKKARVYLTNKYNAKVADEFFSFIDEEEIDSIDTITNDLNQTYSDSSIVESVADEFDWNEQEQTKFFHSLRILFQLETECEEKQQLPSDINWTNFTDNDCKETRKYINTQCHNAFSKFDQSFITLETIGRNNNINIVPLLFDIYSFYKYKYLKKKEILNITHSQFCTKSETLKKLKGKDEEHKKIYSSLVQTLASFQHRINPSFNIKSYIKIDDNINPYIQYTLNISKMLNKVIKNNDDCLPLLVDLWIIPAKVKETLSVNNDDGDDDDSDDDDEKSDDYKEDTMTKTFESNLKQYEGTKYTTDSIDYKSEAKCMRTLEQCFQKILNFSRRSIKICIIIDRRKEENNLLIYQLPWKYSAISRNYCNETLIYSSSEFIMYDIDNSILKRDKKKEENDNKNDNKNDKNTKEPIFGAKFDCDGKMFCLSFALHEINKTRIQFWRNGGGLRFWPNYMINLWPKLFINPKINKKYKENDYIQNNFGLNVNDPLFDAWYDSIVDFDK